jgi:hypothetical protein
VLGTPSELDVKRMNPTYPYKEVIKVKPSKRDALFPPKTPEEAINLTF